ncbi:hypothetical protein [Terrarubrum flagellatum]|uniref:hypothetical protein n=1 Tax=Terrirubrum flagellatum TaxID=2895980 RepID=UPI003145043A
MATKRAAKKKRKPKLSVEELKARKLKRDHIRAARTIFRNLGFDRVSEVAGAEVAFENQRGEFDDAYIRENVIILLEYTTSKSENVKDHLKKKKIFFSKIAQNPVGFIAELRSRLPKFEARLADKFHDDKYILKMLYCSRNSFDDGVKKVVDEPVYLDFPILKYFEKLASTIKISALNEFLEFVGIANGQIAENGKFPKRDSSDVYEGSILPESSSGFPRGYKVVSFYADPAALLLRAYVLRSSGWRGSRQAYQRMLRGSKIEAIRKNLKAEKRVFVNNLIATLPNDAHPVDQSGKTIDITKLTNTSKVTIRLPSCTNSVGLIDGQHRLYSYYESRNDDLRIATLRHQQNLLVTGIIYPPQITQSEKDRFEADLFLSINANQTNASTALKQDIEVVLRPFSPTAIGREIMRRLAGSSPLAGHVETYFFDKGKLKTSSIVSYGLGPLIKLGGEDSLFRIFKHPEKDNIASGGSEAGLEAYLQFATSTINAFLGAVKDNVDQSRWTSDRAVNDRLLTVTYVNSFLIVLRLLIQARQKIRHDSLKESLKGLNSFNFKSYRSSQYGRMAEKIFEKYFDEAT